MVNYLESSFSYEAKTIKSESNDYTSNIMYQKGYNFKKKL